MKKFAKDNPFTFAIITNGVTAILFGILGTWVSITWDLAKFFPEHYSNLASRIDQREITLRTQEEELKNLKEEFLKIIRANLDKLPKYDELKALNDPFDEINKGLVAIRAAAKQGVDMSNLIYSAVDATGKNTAEIKQLILSLTTQLKDNYERELIVAREEKRKVEKDYDEVHSQLRTEQRATTFLRDEIGDHKALRGDYKQLSAELLGLYLSSLDDKSFFNRTFGLIKYPFESIGDVADMNLWSSKQKRERAEYYAKRIQALNSKEEAIQQSAERQRN